VENFAAGSSDAPAAFFILRCAMQREPLYMKVSIGGDVVRREAEPLHLYDNRGRLIATRMQPAVRPGELLVERMGTFPKIIREVA
jgi:hypothetical protein